MNNPAIRVRALSHRFGKGPEQRYALRDLSFDVAPGEIIILTGPSGSGKSSLFSLIGGLRSVQVGELTVLGIPLHAGSDADLSRYRQKVRFIFQQFHLLDSLTAVENVMIGCVEGVDRPTALARAEAMLDKVGLADRCAALRSQLSGGEQQRVAIARALVSRPALLLADEPTAALDSGTGKGVIELLRDLARDAGCTVFIATHDERLLPIADRRMRIEDGTLQSEGPA